MLVLRQFLFPLLGGRVYLGQLVILQVASFVGIGPLLTIDRLLVLNFFLVSALEVQRVGLLLLEGVGQL